MKLLTFELNRTVHLGAECAGQIVDLPAAFAAMIGARGAKPGAPAALPSDMLGFLRSGEPAMIEHLPQAAQHRGGAVGLRINAVNEFRSGQMQFFPRNGFAMMFEQTFGAVAQELFEFGMHKYVRRLINARGPDARPSVLRW